MRTFGKTQNSTCRSWDIVLELMSFKRKDPVLPLTKFSCPYLGCSVYTRHFSRRVTWMFRYKSQVTLFPDQRDTMLKYMPFDSPGCSRQFPEIRFVLLLVVSKYIHAEIDSLVTNPIIEVVRLVPNDHELEPWPGLAPISGVVTSVSQSQTQTGTRDRQQMAAPDGKH